ncbi:MAG: tRNA-dihydrouridine synthase family protein, partial [Olegusella sp.]|nr:tRNA-dihydrouridine synthase family protein [Olegusella sp.]
MTEARQDAQDILEAYASAAGLELPIAPFAGAGADDAAPEGDLRARWAANPFMMAPMAGVSDAAYRMMARAGGAAVAYSEMVSVAGIHFGGDKTWELALPHDPEPDIAVQLFGSRPEQFREAAEQVYLRLGKSLALLDINMACPVPKVAKKGEGAALIDDPARAYKIVEACREGIDAASQRLGMPPVPVTCKIRRGVKTGHELAPVFAEAMEQAGVAAVAVHGRYADQFYRGE